MGVALIKVRGWCALLGCFLALALTGCAKQYVEPTTGTAAKLKVMPLVGLDASPHITLAVGECRQLALGQLRHAFSGDCETFELKLPIIRRIRDDKSTYMDVDQRVVALPATFVTAFATWHSGQYTCTVRTNRLLPIPGITYSFKFFHSYPERMGLPECQAEFNVETQPP